MRQRAIALSGWMVAGLVTVAGMAGPNEVRTRRLVVEDSDGMGRVVIEVVGGKPTVRLNDAEGVRRAEIGLNGTHDEGYCSLYKHREMKKVIGRP